MRFRTHIALLIGRLLYVLLGPRLRAKGVPGRVARAIDPGILRELPATKVMNVVTGSFGVMSTAALIHHGLRSRGLQAVMNDSDLTDLDGAVTYLLKRRPRVTHVVLACDPDAAAAIIVDTRPDVVTLTPIAISRRYDKGDLERIYADLREAIHAVHPAVVAPGDDPAIAALIMDSRKRHTEEGGPPPFFYRENTLKVRGRTSEETMTPYRLTHCPRCSRELSYDAYGPLGMGIYHCGNCGFRNPDADLIYQWSAPYLIIHWTAAGLIPGQTARRMEMEMVLEGDFAARDAGAALGSLHRLLPAAPLNLLQVAVAGYQPELGIQERIRMDGRTLKLEYTPSIRSLHEKLLLALDDPSCFGIVLWLSRPFATVRDNSNAWDMDMTVLRHASGLSVIFSGDDAPLLELAMRQQDVHTPKPEIITEPGALIERLQTMLADVPEGSSIYLFPDRPALRTVRLILDRVRRESAEAGGKRGLHA